jgi:site-specific DNA recombinase
MPSANGHGPKRAILYARVSTDEQARSGHSLAQQLEALREYAAREGYEVLKEISDPGWSGAYLDRPGMDHVRDLVAEGGVSVVLAQDRDRFAREPAYHYLLKREFEEYGTKMRALNDRGDDSPEGELTDGILDQLAKYERAKIAERSRRGKARKAREGKVIAGRMAKYGRAKFGFKSNDTRDGLVVDEEAASTIRRIFYMIGVEGKPIYAVKRALDAEGVPTPTGKEKWATSVIRDFVQDDLYRPHTYEEVMELVSPAVTARLDPEKRYGLWRWGRRRIQRTSVSEIGANGRVYRQRQQSTFRPEKDWIFVPVPDSGVPREWVDAAREAIRNNHRPSNAGRRFWELSGGTMRCGTCGYSMTAHTSKDRHGYIYFYYVCKARYKKGPDVCSRTKHLPAAELEARVWEAISAFLKDPDQLRAGLNAMLDLERSSMRGDPKEETRVWADKLAEVDRKRARYQEMAAADLISFEELRSKLAELEDIRNTAEHELEALRTRGEYLNELERDRDALLDSLMNIAPEALDALSPQERHHIYRMLRLKVFANPDDSLELSGALGDIQGFCQTEASRL